ncbi:MAG: FecR family protein [Treponema sp.]|jgi:hypothetical protein|nr:FecR family protein [Treponema sp.]
MKTSGLIIIVVLLCSALGAAQEASTPSENRAVIREIAGLVELKVSDEATWVAAKRGDILREDTVISTGFRSTAILALGNSIILVRPITRLTLRELADLQGNQQIRLELMTGRIRAEVNSPAGGAVSFTVISPMVTASVRGTVFEFDTINLLVEEGTVRYLGEGNRRAVSVRNGQKSWVDEVSGKVVPPKEAAMADLDPILPGAATSSGFVSVTSPEPIPPAPTGIDVTIQIAQ